MNLNYYFADNKTGIKKFGAEVIKSVQGTNFDHFAIGLEDEYGETIYEAVFPKSHKISKTEWLKEYEIKYSFSFPIPVDHVSEVYQFLESQIGKWYAFDQCIWIAIITWFKIKRKFSDRVVLNRSDAIICTELGYLVSKQFFKNVEIINQDRVDLVQMLNIAGKIMFRREWI